MTSTSQRIDIGHLIKQENKDVSHFTRKPLWSGSASEFLDNGRETPATIIQQQLDASETFAFRAIGGKELQATVVSDGIGGEGYQGTNNTDSTLFAMDLKGAPLAMMDGRTYGGQDDRDKGGFIIVVRRNDILPHTDNSDTTGFLNVVTKIPLEKLYAIFRIDRKPPTYATPDDTSFTYDISKIVPKPKA